ncbi:3-isopropylmalate dehydratase small subunit [Marinomonas agarivorans]|nr:3-isopropylmalate dehydratase small subunit [Marinomonas agarivorans]
MRPFTQHKGIAAPLDLANVDTDMIIPKQFLKSIKRTGFGKNLFDELRYQDEGQADQDCSGRPLREDFILNKTPYQNASILLARRNFGCGSSREHAPWALDDFGFRAVIAPSFADIFFNNCFKNGLLPIQLTEEQVEQLFQEVQNNIGCEIAIDLEQQQVSTDSGLAFSFAVDEFRKACLLNGLDDIGLTLQDEDKIHAFETRHKASSPWLFAAKN